MELRKQRFLFKQCDKTFTLETNIVEKHCNISKNTKLAILEDAKEKLSEKQIAKNNNVSTNSVSRIIFNQYGEHKPSYNVSERMPMKHKVFHFCLRKSNEMNCLRYYVFMSLNSF